MKLTDWLRDLIGFNKYAICWDFEHCGVRLCGRHDGRFLGKMTKRRAKRIARQMNAAYCTTGHWVERAFMEQSNDD